MFPHQKLDWNLSRLEKRVEAAPDDAALRLELARASLSKALYHEGGEVWLNRALTQARRVLQHDPSNPGSLVVAGMALVALERIDAAMRYLEEASRVAPEQADVHLALGTMHRANGEHHDAIRSFEAACRFAPGSWEPHAALGRALNREALSNGNPRRMMERARFHLVRALQLDPSPSYRPRLVHALGINCLRAARLPDAYKLFQQLLEQDRYRPDAQYLLGIVSLELGKHKNAILFLRQHLKEAPATLHPGSNGDPTVHARIGLAYLELGEPAKAREACNQALAVDPSNTLARFALARALRIEGQPEESLRILKELLEDAPHHTEAFAELVAIRTAEANRRWLGQALRSETAIFDRLPVSAWNDDPHVAGRVRIAPRDHTRERISILVDALSALDADAPRTILECMDLTTDEGLRFALWESALDHLAADRASDLEDRLDEPGRAFGVSTAREILPVADRLPEDLLINGLQVGEEDLRRAAVDRHGPARDVAQHRQHVDRERQEARAWQALLLLSIAAHGSRTGRNLLLRWAADADPDLADAARAGLAMFADPNAVEALRVRARGRGAEALVDNLVAQITPSHEPTRPQPVTEDRTLVCSTCGRKAPDVEHMLRGEGDVAICNHCMTRIARERRTLGTDDPSRPCSLCGNTLLQSRSVYVYRGVPLCADCVDDSLGLQEREEVERFLASV